jgi:peroxiredoxin
MKMLRLLLILLPAAIVSPARAQTAAQAPASAASVAEIQSRHDRAFMRELTEYLERNPKADDRDQAYAALFNKAIEHDWFADTENQGLLYLKTDPDGPVKALAQIIVTMARAQANQFEEALKRFRELMQGIGQNDQEEFAASFAETLATSAIAAGEFTTAKEVYTLLLSRFGESPNLKQKVQGELKRLDKVGKSAPAFTSSDIQGRAVRLDDFRGKYLLIDFWATWCAPCIAELPRLQAAYRTYHEAGLEILGVSLDESKPAVVDFAKARNVPWHLIHNASAPTDLVEAFGVSAIPATYLVDPAGTVVRLDLRGKVLDETLKRLIKTPASVARKP